MPSYPSETRTALVLGGGGITGIAWELGILAGLAAEGVDLTTAELVLGTSAGSVVGAQITSGTTLEELYQRQRLPSADEQVTSVGPRTLLRLGWALARSAGNAGAFRRRVGAFAVGANTPSEAERLEIIGARLPCHEWPERELRITSVDAGTGEPMVWTRSSGVGLAEAVASSCAVPGVYPPVTIDGRRYVDGGVRSAANVDLAAGYERVVILAPITRGIGPLASIHSQLRALHPARTMVIAPDGDSRSAIGRNVLDPAARAPSALAGRTQAAAVSSAVRAVWAD